MFRKAGNIRGSDPVKKMNVSRDAVFSLLAELVLDDAIKQYQIMRLYTEIDQALDDYDQQAFLDLSGELRGIIS
jgi:uncharacterized protein YpiB (UPF0302 family)